MGANVVAFIKALGPDKVDVLGFSIGGFVSQEITLAAPDLVRRLVLVRTGPRSGQGMDGGTPEGNRIFGATYDPPDHLWLSVFFTPSPASQATRRRTSILLTTSANGSCGGSSVAKENGPRSSRPRSRHASAASSAVPLVDRLGASRQGTSTILPRVRRRARS
jgi:pimeloyl-ACP methyl ester carboxylesterase